MMVMAMARREADAAAETIAAGAGVSDSAGKSGADAAVAAAAVFFEARRSRRGSRRCFRRGLRRGGCAVNELRPRPGRASGAAADRAPSDAAVAGGFIPIGDVIEHLLEERPTSRLFSYGAPEFWLPCMGVRNRTSSSGSA